MLLTRLARQYSPPPLRCVSRLFTSTSLVCDDVVTTTATTTILQRSTQIVRDRVVSSSCAEGTVMTGLNIMKDGQDPVAMADDKYPDWLWQFSTQKTPDDYDIKKRIRRLRKMHIKQVNSANAK